MIVGRFASIMRIDEEKSAIVEGNKITLAVARIVIAGVQPKYAFGRIICFNSLSHSRRYQQKAKREEQTPYCRHK